MDSWMRIYPCCCRLIPGKAWAALCVNQCRLLSGDDDVVIFCLILVLMCGNIFYIMFL